jgi:phosphoribosylanthranilate isomerase
MVTDQLEFLLETAQRSGFRWVQPYLPAALRGAAVASLRAAGLQVLLPWADEPDQEQVPADLYLWEPSAAVTGLPGGSGQGHGMLHPPPGPFLLAGGLDAANLKTKVGQVPAAARPRFRGVDAASRLEAGPDRKDPQKVTDFICRAHELELV